MCPISPRELVAVLAPVLFGSVQQTRAAGISAAACLRRDVGPLACAVQWAQKQEQLKVVSRAGVAGSLPVKSSTNSAAFNLQAAFKVF